MTNAFVSVPADMGQLNCAAFLAGIIAGVLDSARFVSHTVPSFIDEMIEAFLVFISISIRVSNINLVIPIVVLM